MQLCVKENLFSSLDPQTVMTLISFHSGHRAEAAHRLQTGARRL